MEYPTKKRGIQAIPQDPLIYRYTKWLGLRTNVERSDSRKNSVTAHESRSIFHEIRKEEDRKGDRVVLTWNGSFCHIKSWIVDIVFMEWVFELATVWLEKFDFSAILRIRA